MLGTMAWKMKQTVPPCSWFEEKRICTEDGSAFLTVADPSLEETKGY